MDSTMPPVYSTTANNDDTASSFDSDHDGIFPYYDPFLLQENEVKSSQDLTAFFSPLEAKKVAKELVPSVVEEEEMTRQVWNSWGSPATRW
jgi:hypothetical protein